MVGDGTSLELITAARYYAVGPSGRLALDGFPQTAFVRTYSASDLVTDSSAGATAWARGVKAINRVVGMADASGTSRPPSILDVAKKAGWSTAVITDDEVTGATPAAFLVEHASRSQYDQIASKIADQFGTRADLVLGGGSKWFFDETQNSETYKANELAVVTQTQEKLSKLPVRVFTKWEDFKSFSLKDGASILGLFTPKYFSYYADGTRSLRLKDMVEKAVELLRAKGKPFLLVVEAALPDKACHQNMGKRAIGEVLELDATLLWLRENLDPKTLILVTTDHNTGGLIINGPPMPTHLRGDAILGVDPVTQTSYLTWASGPGAKEDPLKTGTSTSLPPESAVKEALTPSDVNYTQPALIPKGSAMHTGGDVWLLGSGVGSEKVRGFMENTDIFGLMEQSIQEQTPKAK